MTRIEKHLPIPSAQIEEITIDLSDITARERAGENDEPVKKQRVRKSQVGGSEETGTTKTKKIEVASFELIENKDLEKVVRMMYADEAVDFLQMSKQHVHTPFELCWEILENLGIDPNKKFLVVTAVEFVVVLLDIYKVPKENIFFLDEGQKDGTIYTIKGVVLEELGLEQYQILTINGENKMKFDYVVGNPPFSMTNPGKTTGKRSVVLYPEFYRHAVLHAELVAMIMPDTANYASSAHNEFLVASKAKAYQISEEMHKKMGIIIKTWYVIHKKGDAEPCNIVFTSEKADLNSIPIQKGRINLSTTPHSSIEDSEFCIPVVKGMTRKGMELRFIRPDDAKFKLLSGQFAVVFPLCVQPHGWSHCEIVEGIGQCFNINTFYIVCGDKKEAEYYKQIITSETFINQANVLKGNSGTMGLEKFKKIKI